MVTGNVHVVSVIRIAAKHTSITLKLVRVPCGDAAPIVCYECDCGETMPGFLANEKYIPQEIYEEIMEHVFVEHIEKGMSHGDANKKAHQTTTYYEEIATINEPLYEQLKAIKQAELKTVAFEEAQKLADEVKKKQLELEEYYLKASHYATGAWLDDIGPFTEKDIINEINKIKSLGQKSKVFLSNAQTAKKFGGVKPK